MNASRLQWFRFRVGRSLWRCIIVPRIVDENSGAELLGRAHLTKRVVEIAAWQEWSSILETTIHEMMHAAGGYRASRSIADIEAEERYISRAERRMWQIVVQFGFRLPDLPEGFAELRAIALEARGDE